MFSEVEEKKNDSKATADLNLRQHQHGHYLFTHMPMESFVVHKTFQELHRQFLKQLK